MEALSSSGRPNVFRPLSASLPVSLAKMSGHYFVTVLFFAALLVCNFPKRCLEGFMQAWFSQSHLLRAEDTAAPKCSAIPLLLKPTGILHCPLRCWSLDECNCKSESHFNDKCFKHKAIKFFTQLLTLNELFRLFPSPHPTPINLFLRGMYLWSHVLVTWLRLKIALETHSS